MKLKILGSNSLGNAYVLQAEKQTLLLECGVHPKYVMEAINHNLDPVVGCLVSHNHGDHYKYAEHIAKYGIEIYGSYGTLKDNLSGTYGHRFNAIPSKTKTTIGEFTVFPFDIIHDAPEPFGYMINHPESGNILFITDSSFTQYKFSGINHAIVEANHSEEFLRQKVLSGHMEYFVYKRLIDSHMSIETCEKLLLSNDLTDVNNIILIHLSDSNSHEVNFKNIIEQKTGKIVTVGKKGIEVNLLLEPF